MCLIIPAAAYGSRLARSLSSGAHSRDPLAWPGRPLQRYLPVLPITQAGFFQVEVAFDAPPCFVGDLAVPQQRMDEHSLGGNQFARQRGAGRRDVVGVGVERIRELAAADFVPGAQEFYDFVG